MEQGHETAGEDSAKAAREARKLEEKFGDLGADYAEVREETAREIGDEERAEQWAKVEGILRSSDEESS